MSASRAERAIATDPQSVSLVMTVWQRIRAHDLPGLSAEMAYRFLFALFPFALFLASVAAAAAGILGVGDPTGRIIDGLGDNLPPDLAGTVRTELEHVLGQQRAGLATVGAIVGLWAATTGTMTVIKSMNRAYDVREDRSLVHRYLLGIGLTIAGSIGIMIAFVTIVGGALLTEQAASRFGLEQSWWVISLLRWPIVFGLLVIAATIIYRVGPNLTPTWRTAATGAAVFAIGWLVATFAFALYVGNVANYGATYGTLGGVMVMMIWLYLTGMVLLVGAEVVAIMVDRSDPAFVDARRAEIAAHADAMARHSDEKTRKVADRTIGEVQRTVDGDASERA